MFLDSKCISFWHFPTGDTITRRTISSGPSEIKSPYAVYIYIYICVCVYMYMYVYYIIMCITIFTDALFSFWTQKGSKICRSGPFTCGQAWLQHSSGCLPKNGRVFHRVAKENAESDPYGYNFIFYMCLTYLKWIFALIYIYKYTCMYITITLYNYAQTPCLAVARNS